MYFVLKFILGILAGITIGLGASIYELTRVEFTGETGLLLASVAFSVGLIIVCICRLDLFTGRVGFALDRFGCKIAVFDQRTKTQEERSITARKIIALPIMLIGNIIGAYGYGILVKYLENEFDFRADALNEINAEIVGGKLMPNYELEELLSIFISAILCGVLVYLAVYAFRNFRNRIAKIIGIIIPITLFVYLGYEHCIANCYYFGRYIGYDIELLNANYQPALAVLGITIVGNMLGSIMINMLFYLGKLISRPKYIKAK